MSRRLSPLEAKQKMDSEGYIYVDVRTVSEYAASHPAGAVNIPLLVDDDGGRKMNPEFADVVSKLFPKDTNLVVGCESGQRSMRALMTLTTMGYPNVLELRSGFSGARSPFGRVTEKGWRDEGLPVETTTPGGAYAEILARIA